MKELHQAIRHAGISGQYCVAQTVQCLPDEKGAYLLMLQLDAAVELNLHKTDMTRLEAGWYIYSGSAKGPGGLRSRLRRHFRKTKKSHWHVDQLTMQCTDIAALSVVDGDECQFISILLKHPTFSIPRKRFGSTDCRKCASHLLQFNG